jgi:hypothetical protein
MRTKRRDYSLTEGAAGFSPLKRHIIPRGFSHGLPSPVRKSEYMPDTLH